MSTANVCGAIPMSVSKTLKWGTPVFIGFMIGNTLDKIIWRRFEEDVGRHLEMAAAIPSEPENKADECYANKEDDGEDRARITVYVPRLKRRTKVDVTYPKNVDDRLIVQAEGVIYFSERLPDTVLQDKCKVSKKRHKNNETKIKIKLAKEKKGMWEESWCIQKQT